LLLVTKLDAKAASPDVGTSESSAQAALVRKAFLFSSQGWLSSRKSEICLVRVPGPSWGSASARSSGYWRELGCISLTGGRADENARMTDCYFEKKDWRACTQEMKEFKECWQKHGNDQRTDSKDA
jgi:hypothetical protein